MFTAAREDGKKMRDTEIFNEGGKFYPGGVVYSLNDIKAMGQDFHILALNMEGNDWPKVVKTRAGNFQPFLDEDVVLDLQPKVGKPRKSLRSRAKTPARSLEL